MIWTMPREPESLQRMIFLPDLGEFLGQTTRERLNTFVHDVIENSIDQPSIQMSAPVESRHSWIFDQKCSKKVYLNPMAKKGRIQGNQNADRTIRLLHRSPGSNVNREYVALIEKKGVPKDRAVCDWLSGMTDQYSMKKFKGDFSYQELGRFIRTWTKLLQ